MQLWIDGTEPDPLTCANPACRAPFPPDPTQPAKRFCSVRCRTIHNNALIMARANAGKPPKPWPVLDPESMDDEHWQELACFAGGTDGARAYLEQYSRALKHRQTQPESE